MAIKNMPRTMENDFNAFVDAMLDKEILKDLKSNDQQANIKKEFIEKCDYALSLREFALEKTNDLITKYKKEI